MTSPDEPTTWAVMAADGRERARRRPSRRELTVDVAMLAVFALGAALLIALGGTGGWSTVDAAVLLAAYALASKIELDVGSGYTVPTQVVLVAALLVLPPAVVPLLVLAGLVVAELPAVLRGRLHPARLAIAGGDAIHALAPAAVLTAASLDTVALEHWPVYAAALAAQFGLDLLCTLTREWLRVGVAPGAHLLELRFMYAMDAVLAPIGLCGALAAEQSHLGYLLILPVLVYAWMLASERHRRMEREVELAKADTDAHTDALTGALNRRAWDEHLAAALATPEPDVTIAFLDIDGLKALNDTEGHPAGDALLSGAVEGWRKVLRPGDVLARTGGDEFAISFGGEADVAAICMRLRISLPDGHTCSVGHATARPGDTPATLAERADQRLYADKRARTQLEDFAVRPGRPARVA